MKTRKRKFGFQQMVVILLFLLVITITVYSIKVTLGDFYAWSLIFMIILNIYLYYRASIRMGIARRVYRERLADRLANQNDNSFDDDYISEEDKNKLLHGNYAKCPKCGENLIPNLPYCESCGHQLTQT